MIYFSTPHITYRFYRSGKYFMEVFESDSETYRKTLSLRVREVQAADFGRYTCRADNFLGTDSETMILFGMRFNFYYHSNVTVLSNWCHSHCFNLCLTCIRGPFLACFYCNGFLVPYYCFSVSRFLSNTKLNIFFSYNKYYVV